MSDQTTAHVVDHLTRLTAAGRVVVGITGPPGVGKSHAAAALQAHCLRRGLSAAIVPMDGFHLSNAQLDELGLTARKGAPETFDVAGFVALLARLSSPHTGPVFCPDYDRTLHEPVAERHRVDRDTTVVIVEGNYLLLDEGGWSDVRPHLNFTWYLEAPESVRIDRLVARQVAGGKAPPQARRWVYDVDLPNAAAIALTAAAATFITDSTRLDEDLERAADPGTGR